MPRGFRCNPRPLAIDSKTVEDVIEHAQKVAATMAGEVIDLPFDLFSFDRIGSWDEEDIVMRQRSPSKLFPKKFVIKHNLGLSDHFSVSEEKDGLVVTAGRNHSFRSAITKFNEHLKRARHPRANEATGSLVAMIRSFAQEAPCGRFSELLLDKASTLPPLPIRAVSGAVTPLLVAFLTDQEDTGARLAPVGHFPHATLILDVLKDMSIPDLIEYLGQTEDEELANYLRHMIAHELGHAIDPGTKKRRDYAGSPDDISIRIHGVPYAVLQRRDPEEAARVMQIYTGDPKEIRAETSALVILVRPALVDIRRRTGIPAHPNQLPVVIQEAYRSRGIENMYGHMGPRAQRKVLSYLTTFFIEEGLLAAMT